MVVLFGFSTVYSLQTPCGEKVLVLFACLFSVLICLNTNHVNHIILLFDNIFKPNANDISYRHIVKQYIKCITILIHQLADSPV